MKTLKDFLNEKILIGKTYAYFTEENGKIYINYKDMKIQYDMIYNPKYYEELLLGAKQLIKYHKELKIKEERKKKFCWI